MGRVKLYLFRGQRMTTHEISIATGISSDALRSRLGKGLTVEEAVLGNVKHAKARRLVGQVFGRLRITDPGETNGYNRSVLCLCECGAEKRVYLHHLRAGKTKSCGCLAVEELSGGTAPKYIEVYGHSMSLGQLAVAAGRNPVAIWARMQRGMTPERAAFDTDEDA